MLMLSEIIYYSQDVHEYADPLQTRGEGWVFTI
jgi:hypothetical protein